MIKAWLCMQLAEQLGEKHRESVSRERSHPPNFVRARARAQRILISECVMFVSQKVS